MPVIVRQVLTNRCFILIGPAYGFAKAHATNREFETSFATFEDKLVVVADASGFLKWLPAHEFIVESVDGRSCRDILHDATQDKEGS